MAVDGAKNADILAVQMLALSDETLSAKLADAKREMIKNITEADIKLQQELEEL